MKENKVHDCSIVEIPVVHSPSGNISVLENHLNLPFDVKRAIIYMIYLLIQQGEGTHIMS